MSNAELANLLIRQLDLDYPPVGLARVNAKPPGVPVWTEPVPSACSFWRRAETQVFFASADAHMGCPIGALVMGFKLDQTKQDELLSLLGDMRAVAYLQPDEVDRIPHFQETGPGIVYGPLSDYPLEPEVIIVWCTPRQAMLLEEALGVTMWTGEGGAVFGRPTCAALPASASRGGAVLSLGCIGMRTFTEIPDQYSLVALPATALTDLKSNLVRTVAANERMAAMYRGMKAAV